MSSSVESVYTCVPVACTGTGVYACAPRERTTVHARIERVHPRTATRRSLRRWAHAVAHSTSVDRKYTRYTDAYTEMFSRAAKCTLHVHTMPTTRAWITLESLVHIVLLSMTLPPVARASTHVKITQINASLESATSNDIATPCRAGTYPACYPAATASGYACMVKKGASAAQIGSAISWACGAGGTDCAAISGAAGKVGPCWDTSKQPAQQDIVLFGNYVFEKYYAAHCVRNGPPPAGQPCPGPGSPSAGACGFGGVAELVKAPVQPACHAGPPVPPAPPPPPPPPPSPVPPVPPECHTWYAYARSSCGH